MGRLTMLTTIENSTENFKENSNGKTIEQIDRQIDELQQKLQNVKGTKTEVYTRIVGYHRAVDNWNNGKKEEYRHRKAFQIDQNIVEKKVSQVEKKKEKTAKADKKEANVNISRIAFYKLFTSQLCRNCPPVKDYVKNLPIIGEEVDVTTDLGINVSRKYEIMSTPTVVLFDNNDNIMFKLNTIEELKKIFK